MSPALKTAKTSGLAVASPLPPQVVKGFSGVRGRVLHAVRESSRQVTLREAQAQIRNFSLAYAKK